MLDVFLNKVQCSVVSLRAWFRTLRLILNQFVQQFRVNIELFLGKFPLKLIGVGFTNCLTFNAQEVEEGLPHAGILNDSGLAEYVETLLEEFNVLELLGLEA